MALTHYTLSTVTDYGRQQRRLTDRTDGTVSERSGLLTDGRQELEVGNNISR